MSLDSTAKIHGARKERVQASAQFVDGRFRNTHAVSEGQLGEVMPLMGEMLFGGARRKPRAPLPLHDPRGAWARPAETPLRTTWLGHSTVVLEMDGVRLLTDPVFGERVSPVGFAGPKRFHAVPIALEQLDAIDAVLISHDHYDHLCARTVSTLAARGLPFVTSLGVGSLLEKLGVPAAHVTELDWWESTAVAGGKLRVTATPAQHFSGRMAGGRNRTLWSSWVLQSERARVFFSGDTGLTDEFVTIGARLGPFDLTLLEIGAFNTAWSGIHLGPDNALEAFGWLGGGTLLPVHWSTFDLALHGWSEPAEQLYVAAERSGARVLFPELGQVFEPARVERFDPWWRKLESPTP